MGLITVTKSLLFITLFTICIIAYATNFSVDNETIINIQNDSNLDSLEGDLRLIQGEFQTDANASADAFIKSKLRQGDEATEGGGQFKIGPRSLLDSTKKIGTTSNKALFGGNVNFEVFAIALISFLVFIIGAYGWKAWKGQPD